MKVNRRKAVKKISLGALAVPTVLNLPMFLSSCGTQPSETSDDKSAQVGSNEQLFFSISLAQWSLHKSIFGDTLQNLGWEGFSKALRENPDSLYQGEVSPLDFPSIARNQFGLDAIELVNTFYYSKAKNSAYLADLKNRCDSEEVSVQLIMVDAEGSLGNLDSEARRQAVENHYKWVDAASFLGCHSIRVNAAGSGTENEVRDAAIDGLGKLSEYGQQAEINIIVENHGGYSSDGSWLSEVIKGVGNDYCGTLPDFGNFCIDRSEGGCENSYDRYKGVKELMPYAKGVSAKTYAFDEAGDETTIDYIKMLQIVKESGFNGYVGIEYEGDQLSEIEGIQATIDLLKRVGKV